ncbi:unnamed protein product [Paramecium sonneborni]|uniref:Uncharacterized protein n=1 Tax=Paramecium sonneborni TaxID=65129 RepID=A0A8S1RAL4_9CILI|nr:unnamed protein product [Paramecium sonneborni]
MKYILSLSIYKYVKYLKDIVQHSNYLNQLNFSIFHFSKHKVKHPLCTNLELCTYNYYYFKQMNKLMTNIFLESKCRSKQILNIVLMNPDIHMIKFENIDYLTINNILTKISSLMLQKSCYRCLLSKHNIIWWQFNELLRHYYLVWAVGQFWKFQQLFCYQMQEGFSMQVSQSIIISQFNVLHQSFIQKQQSDQKHYSYRQLEH